MPTELTIIPNKVDSFSKKVKEADHFTKELLDEAQKVAKESEVPHGWIREFGVWEANKMQKVFERLSDPNYKWVEIKNKNK